MYATVERDVRDQGARLEPATPTLLVVASGDFGHRVAARLAAGHPGSTVTDRPVSRPAADIVVLAAGHDRPALADAVDRAAYAARRPWFPVLLDHPHLRCGPVVVPGRTACHDCFQRRRRQHGGPDTGTVERPIPGYADHHVGLAVALARRAVRDAWAPSGERPGGWVRTVDLVTGTTGRHGVVAVDRCPRCRPPRDHAARLDDLAARLRRPGEPGVPDARREGTGGPA
ncbi:TOMM precursor leader peptide-binding protein [Polymorphospora lycopeni]|uniref:TOMM leader peptide-binding protein n=1 Tax=Polymorphospora lycopeni TaxID=3140240 RepID=A0ABV5CZK0_9ACTN